MTGQRIAILVAAVLDVVIFGGWIGKEEVARMTGAEAELPVEGYDPVDLLSGHYLRFRPVAEREAQGQFSSSDASVEFCLRMDERGRAHIANRRSANESCSPFLKGTVRNGRLTFGLERFYVDERTAKEVAFVTPGADTYLTVRIDGQGQAHAVDLVVGGKHVSGHNDAPH